MAMTTKRATKWVRQMEKGWGLIEKQHHCGAVLIQLLKPYLNVMMIQMTHPHSCLAFMCFYELYLSLTRHSRLFI